MLYMVQCGFADPAREAAWNAWYGGPKTDELLRMPGLTASQRFHAVTAGPAPYLAVHSIESSDMFTEPAYAGGGGGRFGDWDPALMTGWTRRLFIGIDELPPVGADQLLVMLDDAPGRSGRLGLRWLDGVDWRTAAAYKDAVALDASIAHRGIAIIDSAARKDLAADPKLQIFAPLMAKRRAG